MIRLISKPDSLVSAFDRSALDDESSEDVEINIQMINDISMGQYRGNYQLYSTRL